MVAGSIPAVATLFKLKQAVSKLVNHLLPKQPYVEIALTRLQLAELLLEYYPEDKKEALEHLGFAISEFREMKMQPSLERALRHKEILGA